MTFDFKNAVPSDFEWIFWQELVDEWFRNGAPRGNNFIAVYCCGSL